MANYFKTQKTQIRKRSYWFVLLLFVGANFVSILSPALSVAVLPLVQPATLYAQDEPDPEDALSTFTSVPSIEDSSVTAELLDKWLDQQAQALLDQMNANQRVGQLFVITFEGDHEQLAPKNAGAPLEQFIQEYHIGGVVISAYYRNFINISDDHKNRYVSTPMQVATLNTKLQASAYGWRLSAEQAADIISGTTPLTQSLKLSKQFDDVSVHVPLFIAVHQDGDDLPTAQLRSGFTPLPTQMALGSTWDPELVRNVGEVVGQELSAVGVNLLLGPHLDIVELPRPDPVGTLGAYSFGGSPFWVSEMGQAYIAGIHRGSTGAVATIAKHFPGEGDVDRLPDQEVATIQRSEEELQQLTLYPFKRVTRHPPMPFLPESEVPAIDPASESDFVDDIPGEEPSNFLSITEGLMSSHMRYSAIQSRETPLSLSTELQELLEQDDFAAWHQGGGLVMSNALGVSAIRSYYDPTLTIFPFLQAAVEAFTAGNDLLYIDRFSNDVSWDATRSNVRETIKLFRRRYEEDSDFAALVDESVRRILRLKLRLYGNPSANDLAALQNPANDLPDVIIGSEDAASIQPPSVGVQRNGILQNPDQLTDVIGEITDPSPDEEMSLQEIIPLADVLLRSERFARLQDPEVQSASEAVIRKAARQSITLLHSASEDYVPDDNAQILIFTDSRFVEECQACRKQAMLAPDTIADIIIRLYGPDSTARFKTTQIKSATFSDLSQLLAESEIGGSNLPPSIPGNIPPEPDESGLNESASVTGSTPSKPVGMPDIEGEPESIDTSELKKLINNADWLIFAMLDVDSENEPDSTALKRFLSQRGEEVREKNLAVFALNAPYFLDATEISKLTVYFGVSSKIQPFLEAAVRALFEGYTLDGSPAVSVPGTRYQNLAERLLPSPEQSIDLKLYDQESVLLADTGRDDENGESTILVAQNASLNLIAGPIVDFNEKSVADGTEVLFTFDYPEEDGRSEFSRSTIQRGSATGRLERLRVGTLHISASSGDATSKEIVIKVEAPTPVPTEIPTEAPTEVPTEIPAETPTAIPTMTPVVMTLIPTATETPIEMVVISATQILITPNVDAVLSPILSSTIEDKIGSTVDNTTDKTTEASSATSPATEIPALGGDNPTQDPRVARFTTLVATLAVMLFSLTLFVTATLRVLPRKTLVHHALWAVNAGLAIYVLYALRLIPGFDSVHRYLGIWDGAILVLSVMLLTLLWLQLRSHDEV